MLVTYEGCPILKAQVFVIRVYGLHVTYAYIATLGRGEVSTLVSLLSIHVSKLYKQTN
jgi:hypothetical protein